MSTHRAAVLGCGRIGMAMEADEKRIKPATHAGAYRLDAGTKLVGLADPAPDAREAAAALFPDTPFYADAGAMLEEQQPTVVSICTPPATHRPLVELCVAKGVRAIVCEKPIAEDRDDACAIIAACRDAGCLLFVNHMRRFDPLLFQLGRRVKEGDVGDLLHGSSYYVGGLFTNGTHLVDLLRHLLGEVSWVTAYPESRFRPPPGDLNVNGMLVFEGDVPVTVQALDAEAYSIFDVRLFARRAQILVTRFGLRVEESPIRDCVDYAGHKEIDVDRPRQEGDSRSFFDNMVAHVVACLEGREDVRSTGEDGLAALDVLLAMKRSSEKGGARIDV